MIEILTSLTGWEDFIRKISADPEFSHPMLAGRQKFEQNLFSSPEDPEKCVLGVTRDGRKQGLFVFLVLKDERYPPAFRAAKKRTARSRNISKRLFRAIRRTSSSTQEIASFRRSFMKRTRSFIPSSRK